MTQGASVLFLSHGGGPMPLLGDPGHTEMVNCLQEIAGQLPRPEAIVVVSAHWEEAVATVTTSAQPDLIYDYYGFPDAAYSVTYPCPGEPTLAAEVLAALQQQGIEARADDTRGLDHGLFVPLKLMYPQADIPCIQLSLLNSLDPESHLRLGEALKPLADKNVLVIGSGFSFHNMRAFFGMRTAEAESLNRQFEDWLQETCSADMPESERRQRLADWALAPGAGFCHPREEHLMPLHVCYGLAGKACTQSFRLEIVERHASMYLWR